MIVKENEKELKRVLQTNETAKKTCIKQSLNSLWSRTWGVNMKSDEVRFRRREVYSVYLAFVGVTITAFHIIYNQGTIQSNI